NKNPQIKWYINNMPISAELSKTQINEKLSDKVIDEKYRKAIIRSFELFTENQLGTILKFGKVIKGENKTELLQRTKCRVTDDRVVLYSLYKYAEECGNYYEFTLSTLLDSTIQSKGVSPVKLFGLEADEMEAILRGLSVKYDDFINVSFTHDLDKIVLRDYHTSQDVLGLF
ncbi:MAG: phosphoadenosine phosphosulfate reductase, partial [bacterium]|nr:phosphoadenosine phosphosulfate reductase [bacterium]